MSANLFVDMFPVNTESIPLLFAYSIKAISDDLSSVGGKLAYRLKNKFGGNWIGCNGQIISDKEIAEDDLMLQKSAKKAARLKVMEITHNQAFF